MTHRPLTLLEIVQDTVFRSDDGVPGIAEELDIGQSTLYNKLNPNKSGNPESRHKLNLHEFIGILRKTGDYRALHKLNEQLGYIAIPIPKPKGMTDLCWIKQCLAVQKESAEAVAEIVKSLESDGRIDPIERKRCLKELFELLQVAAAAYVALLEMKD